MKWQDRDKNFEGYCQHCNEMTSQVWLYDKSTSDVACSRYRAEDCCWHQCLRCNKIGLHVFRRRLLDERIDKVLDRAVKKDGDYVLMISERNTYHGYKPSWLQKLVWFFWPTHTSIQWKRYRNVKVEDCVDSVNFDIEPPKFDKVGHDC